MRRERMSSASNTMSSNVNWSSQTSTSGSNWEDLRKQARILENQIDGKLIELSKLGTSMKSPLSSKKEFSDPSMKPLLSEDDNSDSFDEMTRELDSLLQQLDSVNSHMNDWTERHTPSAAIHHTLQRHGEILKDYKQEFRQTKNNIASQIRRQDLLGSNKIQSNGSDHSPNFRMNLLLKESEHARNSERLIDDQISIAIEARDSLAHQRHTFKAIQTKLNDISNRFPMINNLVQRINLRKRRDAIIVAVVIGLCLTFLLWWMTA